MNAFRMRIARHAADYVALRRSQGLSFKGQAVTLTSLLAFLAATRAGGPLTQRVALEFVASRDVTREVRARRYSLVRRFADYLSAFERRTGILDPSALPRSRRRPAVRILTDKETCRLLESARGLSPRAPLRGLTLCAMLGLLASTGIRSGEALRLDRDDVDLRARVLTVRRSKFRKDRLVPVHRTTASALRRYAAARDEGVPCPSSASFFLNLRGRRVSRTCFDTAFGQARRAAGLEGGIPRGVRPHDLRHRFAVRRIEMWHRRKRAVQALLPALATYLGHARLSDTAYYVTATPGLMACAARRLDTAAAGGGL